MTRIWNLVLLQRPRSPADPISFFFWADVKFIVRRGRFLQASSSRSARIGGFMLDKDRDLRGFSNETRLFPLPNLVMFPHVILPLHIFEPRYRQMTEEALADDQLITMIQISPRSDGLKWAEPVPLESVGCLGRIVRHERLPDGRFNFLLLGLKRVSLRRELTMEKLYRRAEVEILEDLAPLLPEAPTRRELVSLFRKATGIKPETDAELADLLSRPLPLGLLSDVMAHALPLPAALKQQLLNEPAVDRRVETLRSILAGVADPARQVRGPYPPFSDN
jgi:Lon protease-like protein